MKPSVGRIVHYTIGDRDGKYPPEVQAAIVTKITRDEQIAMPKHDEDFYKVTLHIFYPTGQFDRENVPFTTATAGSEEARGKWSWPERG